MGRRPRQRRTKQQRLVVRHNEAMEIDMKWAMIIVTASFVCMGMNGCPAELPETVPEDTSKPVGLIQLIEFHDVQGIRNWAHELDMRGLKALAFIQKNMLEEYPAEFKWLADQGHEIGGGYAEQPFWDVDYQTQLEIMQETKETVERVTGKSMRVFGSKYFAYDESTLKAADALGIEYILARGTSDVESIIYDPDEYACRIISVSNVTFEDMGRGSLCDYSLWARGATAVDFDQVLRDTLAKKPKRIMLACHAYLSGMKAEWWAVYADALDSGEIRWAPSFDDWIKAENGVNLSLPMNLIPSNREVLYTTPTPSVPLEELEDLDQMHNPCGAP